MKTIYGIRNLAGELVAEHIRVDTPRGKQMYWRRPGHEGGLGGLSPSALPLYRSERVVRFRIGQTVVVTEGERACHALRLWDIDAVGTVTGASSTPNEDALAPLLPFDVVTWEDDDEPGRLHMARVASALIRLGGRARRFQWCDVRGVGKGADAADFVVSGNTRETLLQMLRLAQPWVVEPETPKRPPQGHQRPPRADDSRRETARSHLLEVVEAKLGAPLRKIGRSLWWRCPFHADRTPSFKVDLVEPFFICHGCGEKGDVFNFLARSESLRFKDVLRDLAPAPRLLVDV